MDFFHYLLTGIGIVLEVVLVATICKNDKLKGEVKFWKDQYRILEQRNTLQRVRPNHEEWTSWN